MPRRRVVARCSAGSDGTRGAPSAAARAAASAAEKTLAASLNACPAAAAAENSSVGSRTSSSSRTSSRASSRTAASAATTAVRLEASSKYAGLRNSLGLSLDKATTAQECSERERSEASVPKSALARAVSTGRVGRWRSVANAATRRTTSSLGSASGDTPSCTKVSASESAVMHAPKRSWSRTSAENAPPLTADGPPSDGQAAIASASWNAEARR
mmetsp:Transcript_26169/g.87953  ORF Transcript_26169/g.87953 Transcript_26169/m.87953 type:complete len:215 (-) Transcript_26169:745-1389(-)